MGRIEIELSGLHQMVSLGVYDEERARRQQIRMELTLQLDHFPSEDRIENTVNYDKIAEIARSTATSRHFDLIETMAIEIATALRALKGVEGVKVRLRKIPSVLECDELYATVRL